ncbi:pentatricopeptide repeat-containing protein At5g09450, mitochondrial isoform X1 [Ricinus communis]|uniref:pentatricopeptide repeat-containing protein At5g09450, mitochondrial isoform X1 n=1 Tax=Ricinus communis TaxID=3988 RepID=UPI00201A3DA2|nr:pentatricopeptide repeat-containing protein At5g09450, mitochondrial isoform X1 [Ricinus communis]
MLEHSAIFLKTNEVIRAVMASRSFLFNLQRICRINSGIGSLSNSKKWEFNHFLSSGTLRNEDLAEESSSKEIEDDLKSRIFRLRLPKRSATNIIHNWVSEGNTVTASELRNVSNELRKLQRYKHALEISEWMVTNKEFELMDFDYATRIDLMTKVFGIDAAERYFEGLPITVKTSETYTALLHSYAGVKQLGKAEELYERIKGSNLSFTALTYNEMMTLYMSVGQVEKVSLVVEELKRQKIAPDIFTYNLWISSCAAILNIDQVTRILDEMKHDSGCNDDWLRYIDIANIYVKAGHLVNTESNAVVEAEKSITQREWITYDFLIILYAGLRDKDKVDQIWKSLRMTKQKMTNRNFVCILSSYMMLGHLKEAGEVLDQWKKSTTTDFDLSACSRLLDAFSGSGLTEIANDFHMLLIERNCDPTNLTK